MFRIFLRKKLLSGKPEDTPGPKQRRQSRTRNRRLYDRYNVGQQHLTIMNDQDILVIRDLSAKGFSSDVSERAFERFHINDIYEARMRYLGETFDLQIKVTWKRLKMVGFELVNPSQDTLTFFRRLIRPIELANSLKQVDAAFMRESESSRIWFHGDHDTELYLWKTPGGEISAWKLVIGNDFVEWQAQNGISTGQIRKPQVEDQIPSLTAPEEIIKLDEKIDERRRQFATDVIMALQSHLRDELLPTIAG